MDALTDDELAELNDMPVGCECPTNDRNLLHVGTRADERRPPVVCQDCGEDVYGLSIGESTELGL